MNMDAFTFRFEIRNKYCFRYYCEFCGVALLFFKSPVSSLQSSVFIYTINCPTADCLLRTVDCPLIINKTHINNCV